MVISCFSLSACDSAPAIGDHKWKFDCVQSADDGQIIACSADSLWTAENAEIIGLTIDVTDNGFTILNAGSGQVYLFSFVKNNSIGKSTVYDIKCNDEEGIASVGETSRSDAASAPTLIVSVKGYDIYFYSG